MFEFDPPDGYRDTTEFPTTPASETAFRASMMKLLDQIKDYMNDSLAETTQDGWTTPTLLNNVVNFGSGTTPVRYMKDNFGWVHVEGFAKMNTGTSTLGMAIFNLPSGYRPLTEQYYNGIASVSSTEINCRVGALPNGDVIISLTGATWMTLNGIVFRAEA